jgi:hypothetical protein
VIRNRFRDPIENRAILKQDRAGPSRHILRKTLITLAASAVLGVGAIEPNAALAFLPPPPLGGPPPGLAGLPHPGPGLGGPPHLDAGGPTDLSRLAGPPGFRGNHGSPGSFHGRAAAANPGRAAGSSYGRSGSSGRSGNYDYGHNGWRNRYYGAYVAGRYGSSYGYSDSGCYYTYSRGKRVMVCSGYSDTE